MRLLFGVLFILVPFQVQAQPPAPAEPFISFFVDHPDALYMDWVTPDQNFPVGGAYAYNVRYVESEHMPDSMRWQDVDENEWLDVPDGDIILVGKNGVHGAGEAWLSPLNPGTYYVQVRAVDDRDTPPEGAWSEPGWGRLWEEGILDRVSGPEDPEKEDELTNPADNIIPFDPNDPRNGPPPPHPPPGNSGGGSSGGGGGSPPPPPHSDDKPGDKPIVLEKKGMEKVIEKLMTNGGGCGIAQADSGNALGLLLIPLLLLFAWVDG